MTTILLRKIRLLGLCLILAGGLPLLRAAEPVVTPPASLADRAEAARTYDKMFGAEEKQAAGNNKTAARFSAKLIAALPSVTDDKLFSGLLCDKAISLGMRDPEGYPSVLAAIKTLKDLQPDRTAALNAQQVEVYRLIYTKGKPGPERTEAGNVLLDASLAQADDLMAARKYPEAIKAYRDAANVAATIHSPKADEINARAKDVQAKVQILEKANGLATKLAAKPDDQTLARQVLEVYLFDLDDPASAAKAVGTALGGDTQTNLALAEKGSKDLSESEHLTLARWFRDLAAHATVPANKSDALSRSMDHYQAWLDTHEKKDAERLGVVSENDAVARQFEREAGASRGNRIVIWNTHNSTTNDRGADVINVELLAHGKSLWRKENLTVPWEPNKDTFLSLPFAPNLDPDKVRVEIVKWHGEGGGLAEVQVFRGERNIALGAPATASAVFGDLFVAGKLTDGITSSAAHWTGEWLLPDHKAGWAEVSLKPK